MAVPVASLIHELRRSSHLPFESTVGPGYFVARIAEGDRKRCLRVTVATFGEIPFGNELTMGYAHQV